MTDEFQPGGSAAATSEAPPRDDVVARERAPDAAPALAAAADEARARPPAPPATTLFDPGADASRQAMVADTAGGIIRAAREAQGIDLASLAAMLKIPLRKLEALEEGRHVDLPGHTFERALAQAACRVLKLDPKPVLELLPQVGANTLEQMGGGINQPYRERSSRSDFGESSFWLRAGVVVPLLIVLAALALFLVPTEWLARLPRIAGGGDGASAPAALASQGFPGSTSEASSAKPGVDANTGTSTTTVSLPSLGSAVSGVAAGPVPSASPATVPPTAGAVTTPAAASAPVAAAVPTGVDEVLAHSETPSIPVQVQAAADSWIEVVDAQGHVLLSRTVIAGESVGLDGPLPMKLKIGNARGTRLSLRGENVDLEPWTRDNIARLDLK